MKNTLLKNYNSIKNGFKSSVHICYYICLLPVILIALNLLFGLFGNTTHKFLQHYNQAVYLLMLFPIIFVATDVVGVLFFKQKLRFNTKSFLRTYPEVLVLLCVLIFMLVASVLQLLLNYQHNGFEVSTLNVFNLGQGLPFFAFYALCFGFAFALKSRKIAEHLCVVLMAVSSILCILSLIDPVGNLKFLSGGNTNWCSMFYNSNHYGYYLTITTVLCAGIFVFTRHSLLKSASIFSFVLHCFVVFLNNSFDAMLCILIVLFVLSIVACINQKKFRLHYFFPLFSFVATSFAVTFFAQSYYSKYVGLNNELVNFVKDIVNIITDPNSSESLVAGTGRWQIFKDSVKNILSSPIIGTGNTSATPHSEYLQIAEIWGIGCLLFYLAFSIIIHIKAIKNIAHLSSLSLTLWLVVLGYQLSALFGNIVPHVAPYFMLVLGIFVRFLNVDIKKHKLQKQIKTSGVTINDNNVLNQ